MPIKDKKQTYLLEKRILFKLMCTLVYTALNNKIRIGTESCSLYSPSPTDLLACLPLIIIIAVENKCCAIGHVFKIDKARYCSTLFIPISYSKADG